jgi:hypothetical protein
MRNNQDELIRQIIKALESDKNVELRQKEDFAAKMLGRSRFFSDIWTERKNFKRIRRKAMRSSEQALKNVEALKSFVDDTLIGNLVHIAASGKTSANLKFNLEDVSLYLKEFTSQYKNFKRSPGKDTEAAYVIAEHILKDWHAVFGKMPGLSKNIYFLEDKQRCSPIEKVCHFLGVKISIDTFIEVRDTLKAKKDC